MLSHRAKIMLGPAYAPVPLQSCCLLTIAQAWFRLCALWKHCLLANASIFLGVRHVTGLLLCNLATLQCCSCSTTKRCRPSPFQRRAQNVNHPRHRGAVCGHDCFRKPVFSVQKCCKSFFRAVVVQRVHSPDFARAPFGNIVFALVQVCFLDSDM